MKPTTPRVKKPTAMETAKAVVKMLREHFEDEQLARDFARAFAGLVLTMPDPKLLETVLNEERRHAVLSRDPSSNTVKRLADVHGVPGRIVARTFLVANGGVGLKAYRAKLAAVQAVVGSLSDEDRETVAA